PTPPNTQTAATKWSHGESRHKTPPKDLSFCGAERTGHFQEQRVRAAHRRRGVDDDDENRILDNHRDAGPVREMKERKKYRRKNQMGCKQKSVDIDAYGLVDPL